MASASTQTRSLPKLSLEEAKNQFGKVDVVLLTVNKTELEAVKHKFVPSAVVVLTGALHATFGAFQNNSLCVVLVKTRMGGYPQNTAVSTIAKELQPYAIISVGVGWGNKKLVVEELGGGLTDVMVSKKILDFSNDYKVGDVKVEVRCLAEASDLLVSHFHGILDSDQWTFDRRPDCKAFVGDMIASPAVYNNDGYLSPLLAASACSKVIGGDMEAWGIVTAHRKAASRGKVFQWIVVKGICDWGFGKLNTDQPLAAAAAIDLVQCAMSYPEFIKLLRTEEVSSNSVPLLSGGGLCDRSDVAGGQASFDQHNSGGMNNQGNYGGNYIHTYNVKP